MKIKVQTGTPNTHIDDMVTVHHYEADSSRSIARCTVEMSGLTVALVANNGAMSLAYDGGENYSVVKLAKNGNAEDGRRFGILKEAKKFVERWDSRLESEDMLHILDAIENNDMAQMDAVRVGIEGGE